MTSVPTAGATDDALRRRERRLIVIVIGLLCASPFLLIASWYGFVEWPAKRRAQRLAFELQERSEQLGTQGWQRPVLRGAPLPGNAAEEAHRWAIAVGVPKNADTDGVLAAGHPPSDALVLLLARKRRELDALRRSTQHPVASLPDATFAPELKRDVDSAAHLRAVRLLLVRAVLSPPGECLEITADAVRLAQDHVPGGGIVRIAAASAEISSATLAALRCARSAPPDALERASREFVLLAQHPGPTGQALAAEALYESVMAHGAFAMRPAVPKLRGTPEERAATQPWTLLDAFEELLAHSARLRDVDPRRYPADLDRALSELDARDGSSNPLVASPAAPGRIDVRRFLERDVVANAKVRALAVAFSLLARRARGEPTDAAPITARAELADPFSGKPLSVMHAPLRVVSAGPNRKLDGGAMGSDDVVLDLGGW